MSSLDEEWAALRNSLSKAHVAKDIDASLAHARPLIEAAVDARPFSPEEAEHIGQLLVVKGKHDMQPFPARNQYETRKIYCTKCGATQTVDGTAPALPPCP